MLTPREVEENGRVVFGIARKMRSWAARSTLRRLLLLFITGVIVLAAQVLCLNHLLRQSNEASKSYVKAVRLLSEKNADQAALDSISACIESRSEVAALHKWYCTKADSSFRTSTRGLTDPGAQEIFQGHAYLAMRDFMRNKIRGLALDKLVLPYDSSQGKQLTFVVSNAGIWISAIGTSLLMLLIFLYLDGFTKSQKQSRRVMKPWDFQSNFKSKIRVQLDWSKFISSDWPIELRYFSIPEDSSLVYTPWYAKPNGSACAYDSPDATPQSVASVASNSALRAHHRVRIHPPSESIVMVPAYGLSGESILLLDGSHRAVSSRVTSTQLGLVAFVIKGPIDKDVLPDLVHWTVCARRDLTG